ncbi:hypothetical protein HZH68_003398 [Vespula germanica]|uniref:Uncharacterized protein n=1 Tax=Vespula germanica TaxID=30212 RepID=A0A834NP65_VESGE|nr:hypothetical protein HZH68_003398 [Vespula germanica]
MKLSGLHDGSRGYEKKHEKEGNTFERKKTLEELVGSSRQERENVESLRQRTSQKAQGDTKHARRPTFYQGSGAFQDLPIPSPPNLRPPSYHHSTPTFTFLLFSFYFLEKHDDLKASSCCLERYCSFERPLALKRTTAEFFLEITCRGDEL